jgi:hypothetical protein
MTYLKNPKHNHIPLNFFWNIMFLSILLYIYFIHHNIVFAETKDISQEVLDAVIIHAKNYDNFYSFYTNYWVNTTFESYPNFRFYDIAPFYNYWVDVCNHVISLEYSKPIRDRALIDSCYNLIQDLDTLKKKALQDQAFTCTAGFLGVFFLLFWLWR